MSEEHDTTIWQKVRRPRVAVLPEGVEHERRTMRPTVNYLAYLPLALAILAGVAGYVRMQSAVEVLQRDLLKVEESHGEDMESYLGWNKSISERLREVERGR